MKSGLLLLTLLLVAPQQSASSLERVRFNWPVGVNASVTTNYVSETRLDGVSQRRTELRMTHRPQAHNRLARPGTRLFDGNKIRTIGHAPAA